MGKSSLGIAADYKKSGRVGECRFGQWSLAIGEEDFLANDQ
jgi:hypothetical protein